MLPGINHAKRIILFKLLNTSIKFIYYFDGLWGSCFSSVANDVCHEKIFDVIRTLYRGLIFNLLTEAVGTAGFKIAVYNLLIYNYLRGWKAR